MADHYRLKKYQIWNQGVMTSTSTITSSVVNILYLDNIFVQLNVTGTPNGTFIVQVSTDHEEDAQGNVKVAGNWITVPVSPALTVVGAPISLGQDLNQLGASFMRIQYTNTSSSGHVDGFVSGKGLC